MAVLSALTQYLNCTTLSLLTITICLVLYFRRKPRNLPPCPPPLPLIGNLWRILSMTYPSEEIKQLSDKYGPVMRLKLGPKTAVILSSYDAVYEAFVTRSQETSGRPMVSSSTKSGKEIKKGIIMQDGDGWKSLRRFSMSALRDFGYGRNLLQEKIFDEYHYIKEELDGAKDGVFSNFRQLFTRATSNIINGLVFGRRFDYDDEKFNDVLGALDRIMRRFNFMNTAVILDKFPIFASQKQRVANSQKDGITMRSFVQNEVEEHKKDFDPSNVRDYIDVYLKKLQESNEDVDFQDTDVFSAIIDLFIAGTETTATMLTWTFLYMTLFPEIQTRCQKELDNLLDGNRLVMLQDKAQLPYIEATLLEIQRYSSTVPLGVAHRTTADTTIGGYHIPKDTMLMSNLYAAHNDRTKFEAPQVFRPERFLDKDGKVSNVDCVIPFSMGPRVCLGEGLARSELFIFVANLLSDYSFTKVDDKLLDMTPQPKTAMIREALGYSVRVTPRHA